MIITYIRYFPLYLLLLFKQRIKKDTESLLFDEDMRRLGLSFFSLLKQRPFYKVLLYRRLRGGRILNRLFGDYPLFILNASRMPLGGGLYMDHPHGTHLNAKRIGNNLKIKHNVTIGNNHGGVPSIGDDVFIGCGACVLGDINIGNNVMIGANSVVVKSVPDNAVVIGNPACIIKLNGKKVNIKM